MDCEPDGRTGRVPYPRSRLPVCMVLPAVAARRMPARTIWLVSLGPHRWLRGGAQLDADGRAADPLTGVAVSFASEAVAVLADDRDVRLAVQVDGLTAERLHKERVRREMNDSRSFGVSRVELHVASIAYAPDDREGPGAVDRRRHSGPAREGVAQPAPAY